jgi:hypothetical protein
MRALAQIIGQSFEQWRCIGAGREAYSGHIEITPIVRLNKYGTVFEAHGQIVSMLMHWMFPSR